MTGLSYPGIVPHPTSYPTTQPVQYRYNPADPIHVCTLSNESGHHRQFESHLLYCNNALSIQVLIWIPRSLTYYYTPIRRAAQRSPSILGMKMLRARLGKVFDSTVRRYGTVQYASTMSHISYRFPNHPFLIYSYVPTPWNRSKVRKSCR